MNFSVKSDVLRRGSPLHIRNNFCSYLSFNVAPYFQFKKTSFFYSISDCFSNNARKCRSTSTEKSLLPKVNFSRQFNHCENSREITPDISMRNIKSKKEKARHTGISQRKCDKLPQYKIIPFIKFTPLPEK